MSFSIHNCEHLNILQFMKDFLLENEIPGRWGGSIIKEQHKAEGSLRYSTKTILELESNNLGMEHCSFICKPHELYRQGAHKKKLKTEKLFEKSYLKGVGVANLSLFQGHFTSN